MNRETSKQTCVLAPLLYVESDIGGKISMGGIVSHAKRLVEISQKRLINEKGPKIALSLRRLKRMGKCVTLSTINLGLIVMFNLPQISHEKATTVPSAASTFFLRKQMVATHPVLLNVLGHIGGVFNG